MCFKSGTGIVLVSTLATIIVSSRSDVEEGSSCFESHLKTYGTCQSIYECDTTFEAYKRYNISFDLCGYSITTPIVCCVETLSQATNARPNTQTHGTPSPDGSTGSRLDQSPPTAPHKYTHPESASKAPSAELGKRIAEQKCDEYTASVSLNYGVIPLLFDPDVTTFKQPKCNYSANPLVVGGKEADVGEFPHMAAIGWHRSFGSGYVWLCGGSLISERFVLTAAHCTYQRSNTDAESGRPVVVRLGDHDLRDSVQDGAEPITVSIDTIMKNPGYTSPSKYNDIALLKLAADVKFNDFVRPACVYTSPKIDVKSVIATGWGTIAQGDKVTSNVLRKVALKLFSNEECQPNFVYNRNWKDGFSEDQMCAGDDNGGKDTCQGDSGGPLQMESLENPCIFYIIGVTGFGEECGNAQGSGVYAIVSHYIAWIEQQVWGSPKQYQN